MTYPAFLGRKQRREDTVWPPAVRALAATLSVPPPQDGQLPPLWHWALFQEWAPAHSLGADGHPQCGGFLSAEPSLPPRMLSWRGPSIFAVVRRGESLNH